jgi:dipeptidyl aminopeptidase/acylaminoacyl peptidase
LHVSYRSFQVPDGEGGTEQVDAWLVRCPGCAESTPWLADVHGGPASYALLAYTSHPYWQALASRGWGIVALNPVGSSSYGRRFSSRLRGRWGELDLQQHLAVLKQLQEEGQSDERLAIAGKSYGGYLSAWAIGQTSLFRAAVVCAPVTNLETHYGTSDSGYYADPYSMRGEPFIDRGQSQRLSPMKHVQNARTPTLLLQGKDDERCPKAQSEELFVTLMCCGDTPAELVMYPGGSHHFFEQGKPSHRLDATTRLMAWVERWIDVPIREQAPMEPTAFTDGERRQEEPQANPVHETAGAK